MTRVRTSHPVRWKETSNMYKFVGSLGSFSSHRFNSLNAMTVCSD